MNKPVKRRVALISLERWDEVWRRNQHLSAELVRQGLVEELLFVNPPGAELDGPAEPLPGITVLQPPLPIRPGLGGWVWAARWIRPRIAGLDALWINHAALGVHLLSPDVPALYDVTDDWRFSAMSERARRRLLRAEDVLARRASTVVCSDELARRWKDRYGVVAAVVPNGADVDALAAAVPRPLAGSPPHVGYIGTLHRERLDLPLVEALAAAIQPGILHLVGVNALDDDSMRALRAHDNIDVTGPVPAIDVPSWMAAMQVLVAPHVVSDFTLSLDAIKAYEYLATSRPVVATPTSGFQHLTAPGLSVVDRGSFVDSVTAVLQQPPLTSGRSVSRSWAERAESFAKVLAA